MNLNRSKSNVTLEILTRIILCVFALGLMLRADESFAQGVETFQIDPKLMKQIERTRPQCMPEPYQASTHSYAYRLMSTLYDQCSPVHFDPSESGYHRSNMDSETFDKYAILTLASISDPTKLAAAYTAGELTSDALKCLLTSMVTASEDYGQAHVKAQHAAINSFIEAGFTAKDWRSFLKGIPDISSPDKLKAMAAQMDTLLNLYDRAPEGMGFAEAIDAALNAGVEVVSDWATGERMTNWRKAQDSYARCDWDGTEAFLEASRNAANNDCARYGHNFRHAEVELRSFENTNLFRALRPVDVLPGKYVDLVRNVKIAQDGLRNLMAYYDAYDEFERKFVVTSAAFVEKQKQYRDKVAEARRLGSTAAGCAAINELSLIIQPGEIGPQCHSAFFSGVSDMPYPHMVAAEMQADQAELINRWWAELNEIRSYHNRCMDREMRIATKALRTNMRAKPIVQWVTGECRQFSQKDIETELDRMLYSVPPHCEASTVPSDILGETMAEAERMLRASKLWVEWPPEIQKPKEGDTPGIVIDSDPKPGSLVRVGTGVTLTVIGPVKADLMAVPDLLGKDALTARDMVLATKHFEFGGITPGNPAEGGEEVHVIQSVSPAAGLHPKGTVITMTLSMPKLPDAPASSNPPGFEDTENGGRCPQSNPEPDGQTRTDYRITHSPFMDKTAYTRCYYGYDQGRVLSAEHQFKGRDNNGPLQHGFSIIYSAYPPHPESQYAEYRDGLRHGKFRLWRVEKTGARYLLEEASFDAGKAKSSVHYRKDGSKEVEYFEFVDGEATQKTYHREDGSTVCTKRIRPGKWISCDAN